MTERTLPEETRAVRSRDPRLEYWEECLSQSFDEHGISATREQIAAIAIDIEAGRDCMSMAFHVPENPLARELKETQAALAHEQKLIFCETCRGTGRLTSYGGTFQSTSDCWKCRGKGKHLP